MNYHRYPGEVVEKDHSAYLNANIKRWCAICGTHQPQVGGTLRHILGGRHWVCSAHKKAVAK